MRVGEVEVERAVEVVEREVVVADLGRHDRLHARRQRRVAGGDRVVVVEVAALLLEREGSSPQEHRQHDVGLLQHLVAVDDERVEVEQQRVLVGRRALPVPRLEVEERGVLRVDAEFVVERDVHRVGRRVPRVELAEVEARSPRTRRSNASGFQSARNRHRARRVAQVEARHHVRVEVVVDDGRVLVGPGDPWMWNVCDAVARVEPEVGPQAGRLDEDLGTLVGEEVDVAASPRGSA